MELDPSKTSFILSAGDAAAVNVQQGTTWPTEHAGLLLERVEALRSAVIGIPPSDTVSTKDRAAMMLDRNRRARTLHGMQRTLGSYFETQVAAEADRYVAFCENFPPESDIS